MAATPDTAEPRHVHFLLLGGGLASATAAETLRAEGAEGLIALVCAEPHAPYHRPPLSARLLLAETERDPPPVLAEAYYREHDVELLLGTRATAVDTERRHVHTDHAGTLHYDKLLVATGARPLQLDLPGAQLPGIHTLRTLEDSHAIRAAAQRGRHAVVIGSGFIGMEVSSALAQRGVHVTLLAKETLLFDRLQDAELSSFFASMYAGHGVQLVHDQPAAFEGSKRVSSVRTRGGRTLRCDFVVLGVGVAPETAFLQGSGIELDDGVLVDRRLQSNNAHVFAAGDVARFFDPVFNQRRRVEHWDNAIKQGRLAARNMLGAGLPYDEVSSYFCDLFDLSFQFIGEPHGAPQRARIGSLADRSCALLYLREEVPRALFTTGRPARETHAIQSLIRYRTNVADLRAQMTEPGFTLQRIPQQTVLILQGGGAMGAFESGVVQAMEQRGLYPDIVAGVSIGALNGAIVASHPRHAAEALRAFWSDLAVDTLALPGEPARQLAAASQILLWGVPSFFRPRWAALPLQPVPMWTSFYDPTPVKALLRKHVDFEALKHSPVRLLVSAVNVETAALEVFDSYVQTLTPEHLLASGSLPPGFPWTTIAGKHYWDGGIVSNSPLEQVVERCGASGKHAIVVDLFANSRPLPANMMEVLSRRDEIVYAERVRRDGAAQLLLGDFRKLVLDAVDAMPPAAAEQFKQRPRYIQLMGDDAAMTVTRIVREGAEREPASRDYDFSRPSIEQQQLDGHAAALRVLGPGKAPGG